ncbi:MAG: transcriptional regulator PpsR [Pseudomonadota bacterium]
MPHSDGAPPNRAHSAAANTKLANELLPLVATVADIAIVSSHQGSIQDVHWNVADTADVDTDVFRGVPLEDTVTEESRPKVREMLAAALAGEEPRWREINHLIDGIGELPVRYQAMPSESGVIFVGRELRAVSMLQSRLVAAQRALDEDYARLRQLQTRYRVLFQTSNEPLLIADGRTRRIQEANGAAGRLLGIDAAELPGQGLASVFAVESRPKFEDAIERVLSAGQAEVIVGRADEAGQPVECRLTVFRAADAMMLLCRLSRGEGPVEGELAIEDILLGMVGRIPDAVVMTNVEGSVLWCNEAFLGMAETALAGQMRGRSLAEFMSRPGVDLDIIIDNAIQHGQLRAFSSVIVGAFGSETPVEISVASLADEDNKVVGFVMRDISRYDQVPSRKNGGNGEAADHMMNLVGTVPLKELVRASTEEIEKMCIEAALQKTGNNRASAAEMLGLSRQSLYVKLRRFGLLSSRAEH